MNKIWRNNKIAIISLVIVLIFSLIITFTLKNKTINKESSQQNQKVFSIYDFSIEGRTTFRLDNNIYIGNNLKELENGFYDIKIENTDYGICMYLNKLWYESCGKDYIQDNYLAKICRELSGRLDIAHNTEDFEYMLYKYIKDNYIKVRENQVIEPIITENISMEFELEDNIVKLIIRGR